MKCPKCGAENQDGAIECTGCGIFFEKYKKAMEQKKVAEKNQQKKSVPKTKASRNTPPKAVKQKNLGLAIGLNLLLPGLGYMYMGKIIIGIGALLLILIMFVTAGLMIVPVWIVMNAIMAIDMFLLNSKNQKKLTEQNTKQCPNCAELIKKEAKLCRFCGTKFENV